MIIVNGEVRMGKREDIDVCWLLSTLHHTK